MKKITGFMMTHTHTIIFAPHYPLSHIPHPGPSRVNSRHMGRADLHQSQLTQEEVHRRAQTWVQVGEQEDEHVAQQHDQRGTRKSAASFAHLGHLCKNQAA